VVPVIAFHVGIALPGEMGGWRGGRRGGGGRGGLIPKAEAVGGAGCEGVDEVMTGEEGGAAEPSLLED